jgi:hypothetical protein
MHEWVQAQLAAGLPAFRGSAISGTVALNQELLNELLAQWLAAKAQSANRSAGGFDLSHILSFLEQARVSVEAATVRVDFQISV